MVKNSQEIKFFLVLVTVMLSAVTMAPSLPILSSEKEIREQDSATRVERSTDLSRLLETGRKIRFFIEGKYLQLFSEGTVNATEDADSDYSILQRSQVNVGQIKIQGIATCTFLCMDSCGLLYSTRNFGEECIFNEILHEDYYSLFSSTKYSDNKKSMYIAISKHGVPRKAQMKNNSSLGELSSCTKFLFVPVEQNQLIQLENKILATHRNATHHHMRHHQICPPPHHTQLTISAKCHKRKQKLKADDELEDYFSKIKDIKSMNKNKKTTVLPGRKSKRKKSEKKKGKHEGKTSGDDTDSVKITNLDADATIEDDK